MGLPVVDTPLEMPSVLNSVTANGPADASPKRMHVTYDAVHSSIVNSLDKLQQAGFGEPDYLIAISGGEQEMLAPAAPLAPPLGLPSPPPAPLPLGMLYSCTRTFFLAVTVCLQVA